MTNEHEPDTADDSPERPSEDNRPPQVLASDALNQRIERILLGGRRKYTRIQIAEKAGVSLERSRRLWRALGFAAAEDDDVVFTDSDLEAVRIVDRLVEAGLLEGSLETSVARALGQHLSRLAEWQIDLLWTVITENPTLADDERKVIRLVDRLLPELETVQNFVWRRHLASYAGRTLTEPESEQGVRTEVVGFVDMVGYTRMSRRVDETELSDVLDRFETMATETVADRRGRVVKMIGDEVMFVVSSAVDAAEIALQLIERTNADDELPAVRAGLATGRVLSRFGDVYGSVVNIASRLTSLARPGTILVDKEFASELAEEPDYQLRARRSVAVRGYHRLKPAALRRARDHSAGLLQSGQQVAAGLVRRPRADGDQPDQGPAEQPDQPQQPTEDTGDEPDQTPPRRPRHRRRVRRRRNR